jgi:hypothetical protein
MPIDRDDTEERIARVEHILEQLRREMRKFTEAQRQAHRAAHVITERTRIARADLKNAVSRSRAARKGRRSRS